MKYFLRYHRIMLSNVIEFLCIFHWYSTDQCWAVWLRAGPWAHQDHSLTLCSYQWAVWNKWPLMKPVSILLGADLGGPMPPFKIFFLYVTAPYSWFFEVLKFCEWPIFSFLWFYFHECVCQKLSTAMGSSFFQGVKFHKWSTSTKFAEFTYLKNNQLYGTINSMKISFNHY